MNLHNIGKVDKIEPQISDPYEMSEKTNTSINIFENINFKKINAKKFSDKPLLTFSNVYEFEQMDNGDEAYVQYCSDINYYMYRYQICNQFTGALCRYDNINIKKFINNLFKYYHVPEESYSKNTYYSDFLGKIEISTLSISFSKKLFLQLGNSTEATLIYDKRDEEDKNSLLYTILGLLKNCQNPRVPKNKIFIVYRDGRGFEKMGFSIKKIKVNLSENYNSGFETVIDQIIKGLNNKKESHLVIMQGAPGTGKTTCIRFLASKLKKNIIFISPDMVDSLTDPAFIPFLMQNNDSILIIEDAEPALEKRGAGGRSSAVSNVLNLTDGLLSDCLKISIVATFNTNSKNIDDALIRKGRLLKHYKFEKLCIEKSKALLEKLGHKDIKIKEPMTLADIYYYGVENGSQQPEKKKIGF
jgi:hypothetical protein